MEPLTIFASSVGCIGVIHLMSTAVNRLGKGIYYGGKQQMKWDEWYCFFKPSNLLGEDLETEEMMNEEQQVITEAQRREQMRRRQANRPRLQV